MDESDVAVGEHGLDLEMALARNHHGERLSRRNHASHRMNGELLHDAIDRRGQMLEFRAPLCLDHVLRSARSLLLGFRECVIGRAPILRGGLFPRLLQQSDGRIGFAQPALLQDEILLKADEILKLGEIGDLRSQCLVEEILANVDPLLQHRYRRLELPDARRSGRPFRFLLILLALDLGELGVLFGALADQKLTMHLDLRGACALRRPEGGKRILRERRAQPRDVESGRKEIAPLALLVGFRHRRVELDQNVASLDALSVAYVDGADNARLERLDQLGAPAWHDLARRGRDDIDAAE
jgi:hypothetical protein